MQGDKHNKSRMSEFRGTRGDVPAGAQVIRVTPLNPNYLIPSTTQEARNSSIKRPFQASWSFVADIYKIAKFASPISLR